MNTAYLIIISIFLVGYYLGVIVTKLLAESPKREMIYKFTPKGVVCFFKAIKPLPEQNKLPQAESFLQPKPSLSPNKPFSKKEASISIPDKEWLSTTGEWIEIMDRVRSTQAAMRYKPLNKIRVVVIAVILFGLVVAMIIML